MVQMTRKSMSPKGEDWVLFDPHDEGCVALSIF